MDMEKILTFLSDLECHNERDWYHAHKAQYQEANQAFETLVQELIFEIGQADASVLQNVPKELTFRLTRDTRFSHDKSPYLPAFRAHIGPNGKLFIPVGYYLFLKPGDQSFLGGGVFASMFKEVTTRVRDAIVAHSEEWEAIVTAPDFQKYFTVRGEKLKNVPRGYEKEHPQGEYLKHKSWYLECPVTDTQLKQPDFVSYATEVFLAMRPFNAFINRALEGFEIPKRE